MIKAPLIADAASILDCKMPYQFNVDVVGTEPRHRQWLARLARVEPAEVLARAGGSRVGRRTAVAVEHLGRGPVQVVGGEVGAEVVEHPAQAAGLAWTFRKPPATRPVSRKIV